MAVHQPNEPKETECLYYRRIKESEEVVIVP